VAGLAAAFAERWSQAGARAFTLSPSSDSSAGRTMSAAIAQSSAIAIPLIATE
jgi:hypothetical protein